MSPRHVHTVVLALFALVLATGLAWAADLPTTLMDPYLRIHVSLADDKLEGATVAAKALSAEAQKLGAKANGVATNATKLAAAKDIALARTAFGDLSEAMMAYAKATGATFGRDVNVAYCPMVQKSWLQKGQTIANPYYGKSMLTCGEIRK
ncbi:MAG TPA: DUF3347 domain-containing protein [Vicinamibacterales bacterium]